MKYYRLIVDYVYMSYTFGLEDVESKYYDKTDVYVNNEFSLKMRFQKENKIRISKLLEEDGKKYVKISIGSYANQAMDIIVNLSEEAKFEYREEYMNGEDSMTNVFTCNARLIEDERDFRIPRVLYVKRNIETVGTDIIFTGYDISDDLNIGEMVYVPTDVANKDQYNQWLSVFKGNRK